jgi:hypothetical protein
MPVEALIARAFAAGGKGKIEALLKDTKERSAGLRGARGADFRTGGTREQVAEAVRQAVHGHHLTSHRLAELVDSLEENGAQHIFLYGLSDEGAAALSARQLARRLPGAPHAPTEAYYAEQPQTRTHFENRDGILYIKHIYVAEYWERNETESSETAERRVTVLDKVRRRAVNIVRIRPASRDVEVRIDRARPLHDTTLALALFDQFKASLNGIVDFETHVRTSPIWRGFHEIILARHETYMATDEGYDPAVAQRLSNRRGGRLGTDIRDHQNFRPDNTRDHLNVWWKLPGAAGGDEDARYLHSIMSRLPARGNDQELAKVYIGAKPEPADLEHALNRIRHFTR